VGRTRWYLAGAAATAALFALPASALAANGFTDGVTAGEVTKSSAIVWARTIKPANVTASVQTVSGNTISGLLITGPKAKKSTNNTVQTKVKGLKPGHTYAYRFCLAKHKKNCSDKGHFETAPKPKQKKTIHFAYSGDETGVAEKGQTKPF
jgi:alkaline phosphatase D